LFPRFFGITKTLRPVFRPAAADEEDVAPEVDVPPADELEPEELSQLHVMNPFNFRL
jgi:hypothetical protein